MVSFVTIPKVTKILPGTRYWIFVLLLDYLPVKCGLHCSDTQHTGAAAEQQKCAACYHDRAFVPGRHRRRHSPCLHNVLRIRTWLCAKSLPPRAIFTIMRCLLSSSTQTRRGGGRFWTLFFFFFLILHVIRSGLDSLGLVSLTSEALLSAMTWLAVHKMRSQILSDSYV